MRTIDPKSLEKLETILKKTQEPLTLKVLSAKLKCSRDAVVRKLDALVKAKKGFLKVKKHYVREGKRGPESEAYSL